MKQSSYKFKPFMIVLLCLILFGCGKMSAPTPLEGSGYPHTYPKM